MTLPLVGTSGVPTGDRRRILNRRVRLITGTVIAYNVVEAVVALATGRAASSTALVSFGLDSVVEVLSAAAVAWQFSARDPETRERVALRTVAVAFFALAAYVTVASIHALLSGQVAANSPVGIALAAASLVVMPLLSFAERRTGRQLGSGSVVADSKQTLLCTYLSAALLAGLVLDAALGWSWADPAVGLVVAAVAVREGVLAWRGEGCCAGPTLESGHAVDASVCDCCRPGSDTCCATDRR